MTTKQGNKPVAATKLDAEAVSAYLSAHPDFFQQRSELLAELHIPHEQGDTISLVSHQLRILREQLRRSKARLRELIDIARLNEELQKRLHRLTLILAAVSELDHFFDRLHRFLCQQLRADCTALRLFLPAPGPRFASRVEFAGAGSASRILLTEWMAGQWAWAGVARPAQCHYLFPGRQDIASLVLLLLSGAPLPGPGSDPGTAGQGEPGSGGWQGLLAIGSTDAARFRADMDLELLTRQAQLISALLQPLLVLSFAGSSREP